MKRCNRHVWHLKVVFPQLKGLQIKDSLRISLRQSESDEWTYWPAWCDEMEKIKQTLNKVLSFHSYGCLPLWISCHICHTCEDVYVPCDALWKPTAHCKLLHKLHMGLILPGWFSVGSHIQVCANWAPPYEWKHGCTCHIWKPHGVRLHGGPSKQCWQMFSHTLCTEIEHWPFHLGPCLHNHALISPWERRRQHDKHHIGIYHN